MTDLIQAPNNELERQRPLKLYLPNSVTIVGCGGVGSWIALFLALAGVRTLYLWDHDEVSETNLNRLPLEPSYLFQNKASAMSHMLARLKPMCTTIAMSQSWSPENQEKFTNDPEWIVACTDTWASRKAVYAWASQCRTCGQPMDDHVAEPHEASALAEARCKYIEASADGEFGGCTGEPAMFASRLETDAGYASVPVWLGPCVASAYMVCSMILHDAKIGATNYRIGFRYGGSDATGSIPMIDLQTS